MAGHVATNWAGPDHSRPAHFVHLQPGPEVDPQEDQRLMTAEASTTSDCIAPIVAVMAVST